jgi:uncharacterized membrane protein
MMIVAEIVLGAREWLGVAIALVAVAAAVVLWSYLRARSAGWVRLTATALKIAGIAALAICLVEPLFTGKRPRPGDNLFLVLADNSRSLQLHDQGQRQSRGEAMLGRLADKATWQARLSQDFDVRRYAFDTTLRPVKSFSELALNGQGSTMSGSLASLGERFRGKPVAGVLLLTDGNATDLEDATLDWSRLPPVYPVVLGESGGLVDVAVSRVSVSQTNFEAAPVTLAAEIETREISGQRLMVRVLDEAGKEHERRTFDQVESGQPLLARFQLRPERPGVSFFTVHAFLDGEEKLGPAPDQRPGRSAEATLANNRRLVTVDRGGGPYRVLYVAGHPNWEYKFLRRALEEDDEVDLVGLVRIAKQEPKFTFRGRPGQRSNSIFRGFGVEDEESVEQYDEPVLLRQGTQDADELRGGFPKGAEELFRYQAVILDDIEAEFFTQDQHSLLQKFVSQRGGGLLMLGGKGSFAEGNYQRTPVGEMLPVYLDRTGGGIPAEGYRLLLTREGWLQPWVRVRATEPEEEARLAQMPPLKTVNRATAIKPGASVLAQVITETGQAQPALVVQPFGRGRSAALLVGDLWRWNLKREDHRESDLEKSWRQTVRWLVADVPKRVEVETRRSRDAGAAGGIELLVRARDELFEPLDNATVAVRIQPPDQRQLEISAEPSAAAPGQYAASFVPRDPGAYRATVVVTAPDGSEVGRRETGWTAEPESEEFRTLAANRDLLERIAQETGGEVLVLNDLETFVASLPNRKIPIVESWTYPLWHQWTLFLFAAACLIGEWGLRRWNGLP